MSDPGTNDSVPRIEAAADAIRRLDGEPDAPLVAYGDDARFVLDAADAADPLRAGAKPCECCGETLPGSRATDEHVHMCWECQAVLLGAMVEALLDRDRMLKAIEDGYERIVRAGFAFTTGDLAGAVFDAIQEASRES